MKGLSRELLKLISWVNEPCSTYRAPFAGLLLSLFLAFKLANISDDDGYKVYSFQSLLKLTTVQTQYKSLI